MDHLNAYAQLILITSVIVASATSARITFFLCKRWNMYNYRNQLQTSGVWLIGTGTVAAGVINYYAELTILHNWGLLYGAVFIVVGAIGSAAGWVYLLGGLKAIERILNGLETRLQS